MLGHYIFRTHPINHLVAKIETREESRVLNNIWVSELFQYFNFLHLLLLHFLFPHWYRLDRVDSAVKQRFDLAYDAEGTLADLLYHFEVFDGLVLR